MAQATCAHCGEPFEPTDGNQIYCKDRCRWSAKARKQAARNAVAATRRCSRCHQEKRTAEFSRSTSPYCRPCNNDVQREWRAANPDKRRTHKRRADAKALIADPLRIRKATLRKFGLTIDSFAALLESQGGRCGICPTDDPGGRHGTWHVDHDRRCCPRSGSCGRCVRGLLCQNCNLMIGHAKDDQARLRAGADYLDKRQ